MIIITSYNKVTTEDDPVRAMSQALKRIMAYAHTLETEKSNEPRATDTEHCNTSF